MKQEQMKKKETEAKEKENNKPYLPKYQPQNRMS